MSSFVSHEVDKTTSVHVSVSDAWPFSKSPMLHWPKFQNLKENERLFGVLQTALYNRGAYTERQQILLRSEIPSST